MSNKDKQTIQKAESNGVNNHFEHIKNKLNKALKYQQDNQSSIELLEHISLVFTNDDKQKYQARAIFDEIEFEDRKPIHIIDWQLGRANSYARTLIHEIAHLIISNYFRILQNNGSGAHCLEFAIIANCIEHKIWEENDRNRCYFDSYNIHEDKAYPLISINPCKYDALIKCIQWNTFDDLVMQAEKLANKIRKKLVV